VVLIRAESGSTPAWVTVGGALAYVLAMFFGVKRFLPWFERSFQKHGQLTENATALMTLLMLASALATESLGIHLLFGSFLMGAIMPKNPEFIRHVLQKFESVTVVVLLPLFFAFSGLRTNIGAVRGPAMWAYLLLVLAVAISGKLGGSMVAARMAGVSWREAASLGILMNTRGLMELVILNTGLDIGVISQAVFSIMVLMALITMFMTTPLLEWVYPRGLMAVENQPDAVQQAA